MSNSDDWKVSMLFGHVKHMSGEQLRTRVYQCEMEGRCDKGRPLTTRLDGVKKAGNARSLELRDTEVMCMDREQWREFVNGKSGDVDVKGMAESVSNLKK